ARAVADPKHARGPPDLSGAVCIDLPGRDRTTRPAAARRPIGPLAPPGPGPRPRTGPGRWGGSAPREVARRAKRRAGFGMFGSLRVANVFGGAVFAPCGRTGAAGATGPTGSRPADHIPADPAVLGAYAVGTPGRRPGGFPRTGGKERPTCNSAWWAWVGWARTWCGV